MDHKKYLSEREVSELYGLSVSLLRNWRWRKKGIPFLKVGKKVLYQKEDVERWLESRKIKVRE